MILYIVVMIASLLIASKIVMPVKQNNVSGPATRQDMVNVICLVAIFFILSLVSLLRFQTGNDYNGYIGKFHDAYYDIHVVTEPGFNIITKLVYWFTGKEAYIVVFAVFAIATVAVFIKAIYVSSKEYLMTFFLFMCFGYYYQSLNTMRYYLALALVLWAMHYAISRKYARFILLVLVAACFHKTAIIAIPVFLIANLSLKGWHYAAAAVVSLSGLIFKKQYLELMLKVYPTYAPEDVMSGSATLINIVRTLAVIILAIFLYKRCVKGNREMNFYFNLNFMALLLYSCFSFVPYLSRIGYYLTISQIFMLPALIRGVENEKLRKWVRYGVILAAIAFFAMFLYKASAEGVRILPYHTWLTENIDFIDVNEYSFIELW